MSTRNMNQAMRYLFAALDKARGACARTRELVKIAIAKFLDLSGLLA